MEWPGVTLQQYEAVMKELDLDRHPPAGGLFHVALRLPNGVRVIDLWETAEAFGRFSDDRIMPAVMRVGITSPPTVEFHDVHNVYAPALGVIGSLGASSLPR